jgi:hypothetical protein
VKVTQLSNQPSSNPKAQATHLLTVQITILSQSRGLKQPHLMSPQALSLPFLSNRKHLMVNRVQNPQVHLQMFPHHRILERQYHPLHPQTAPLQQPRVLQGPNLHKAHNQVVFHQEVLKTLNRAPPQIPILLIQA